MSAKTEAQGAAAQATSPLVREIDEAATFLRQKGVGRPEWGIVLGTGLGSLAGALEVQVTVPYRDIPHFPVSTVESHAGEWVFGKLAGRPVVVMRGRAHYYEGYTMKQVTFPVRVLRALGAEALLLTGAAGGLDPSYEIGGLCALTDHVNLMGDNPLLGPNDESLGPRFPDMSQPYDRALLAIAARVAKEQGVRLVQGVFVAVAGPNLETAAEYRFLRRIGADVISMSIVPETLVAVHGGLRVLAIVVVTDLCDPDRLEPVRIESLVAAAGRATPSLDRLIQGVVASGGAADGD
jgi:purine-nucleoside phosphorylase